MRQVLAILLFGVVFSFGNLCRSQILVTTPYTPDTGSLIIHCGVLIDGLSDVPIDDQLVVIINGRIQKVVPAHSAVFIAANKLDLSEYTCLPGLIDTHTHITDRANETADLSIYYHRSLVEERIISKRNAEITLAAGFTTIRNLGAFGGWSGRDIRDFINTGLVAGPRIQTAGFYLTIPGGGGDLVIPGIDEKMIPSRVRMGIARGPEEFRN